MGIYLPNMEMPQNCGECLFKHLSPTGESLVCDISLSTVSWNERPFDCPLVPVPQHGRLIDANALAEHKFVSIPHVSIDGKNAGTAYRLGWNTAIEAIMENAKTIIGGE